MGCLKVFCIGIVTATSSEFWLHSCVLLSWVNFKDLGGAGFRLSKPGLTCPGTVLTFYRTREKVC